MNRAEFRELVKKRPLLLDGAFGTMLHSKGVSLDQAFDAVNLTDPGLVAGIHRDYIDAGADILETNTFGANRFKLAEHNREHQVGEINQKAVAIARKVIDSSFREVLLAGSIGPLGVSLAPLGRVSAAEAQEAFREQIDALVTAEPAGVDLLIIETISDIKEITAAVNAARSVSTDIPVIAQMTFTREDRTLLGNTPDEVATQLAKLDVDAVGVNCSSGPAQILRLITMMHQAQPELMISAVPNAGWPDQLQAGRVMYPATPSYFGEYARSFIAAGANLIGGCCGTNAAHIAAMREALDTPGELTRPLPVIPVVRREEREAAVVDPPTQLCQNLNSGKFIVTVEMSPPKGIAAQKLLAGAKMLKNAGANLLNIADAPLAQMRMSAWAAAHLVQDEVNLETVLHFPTRGRNLIRIQGDLLAAHALGIRNLFVTMGDPTRIGDFPDALDTYDIVPTGLINLIKEYLNKGVDKAGHTIDQPTNFVVGCALNLTPQDVEREMKLLRKKVKNGADFALTQPIFDPTAAREFIQVYESTYDEPILPILAGIKPLYNSRNAEFLHHEVPGIHIPETYLERMRGAQNMQQEGIDIAQEILLELQPFVQGVYMMPAFGRYDLVADVLDVLAVGKSSESTHL
jgi:methionine synthase I (cobalamin-dependent)/5,10-methylenetetrahydrofolate reductase